MPSHVDTALDTMHVESASGLPSHKQPKHLILPAFAYCSGVKST